MIPRLKKKISLLIGYWHTFSLHHWDYCATYARDSVEPHSNVTTHSTDIFQKVTTPGTHLMSLFLSGCKFKRRLATWRNLFPLRYPAWTSPRNTRKCLSCVRQNHFRQSCCYCLKPQGTSCNLIRDVSVTTVSLYASNLQNKRLPYCIDSTFTKVTRILSNNYALWTKLVRSQEGSILAIFVFACFSSPSVKRSRKRTTLIMSHLDRIGLICKGFNLLYGQNKIFSCGTQKAISFDLTPEIIGNIWQID